MCMMYACISVHIHTLIYVVSVYIVPVEGI